MKTLKYEDIKEKVYSELDSINSNNFGHQKQFETTAFILSVLENIEGYQIVDSEGRDRTQSFKAGLNNIMMDPIGSPKVYSFEPCDSEYIKSTPEGYSRYCTNLNVGDNFKIINQTLQEEIGRVRITVMEENGEPICFVTFLEFKDEFKGKFFISDIMKDCVISEYGPRFRWQVHENFMGKEVPKVR